MDGAISVTIAIAFTAGVFIWKNMLLSLIAGLAWAIFGAIYLNGSIWPSTDSAIGLFGLTMSLVFFLYSAVIMRRNRKKEPPQFLEEDEEYSQRLDKETGKKKD